MNIKKKIENIIESEIKYAEKNGSSNLSTCNYSGWDKDVWNYKDQIIKSIRDKGFLVSVNVKFGVTDITTKLNLDL